MTTTNDPCTATEELFESERHEPLVDENVFTASWAEDTVRAIVRDVEQAFDPDRLWPHHVRDTPSETDETDLPPFRSLYFGAAGVLWALDYLHRQGAVALTRDYRPTLDRLFQDFCSQPDFDEPAPSYHLGEVGVALVVRRLTGQTGPTGWNALDETLYRRITDNITNPTLEPVWGASGTMIAAEALYHDTGEDRWRELFLANARHLLSTWREHPDHGCRLWTQDMYGHKVTHIGAGHGVVGNVQPLLRQAAWLREDERATVYRETLRTLRATARMNEQYANWPQSVGAPRPGRTAMLVQWCHGAPGVITALADWPPGRDQDLDELLRRAGELTWRAGPLSKGYGLCHGTAGNGYALLELHRRTGEPQWLERARGFAVHAVRQMRRMRAEVGGGRYSLWTGDLGLGLYLWHCARPDVPRAHYPLQQPPV